MIREFKRWMIYTWTGKTDDGGRKRVIGDVKTVYVSRISAKSSQEIFLKRFRKKDQGPGSNRAGIPCGVGYRPYGSAGQVSFASAGIEYVVGARRLNAMAY